MLLDPITSPLYILQLLRRLEQKKKKKELWLTYQASHPSCQMNRPVYSQSFTTRAVKTLEVFIFSHYCRKGDKETFRRSILQVLFNYQIERGLSQLQRGNLGAIMRVRVKVRYPSINRTWWSPLNRSLTIITGHSGFLLLLLSPPPEYEEKLEFQHVLPSLSPSTFPGWKPCLLTQQYSSHHFEREIFPCTQTPFTFSYCFLHHGQLERVLSILTTTTTTVLLSPNVFLTQRRRVGGIWLMFFGAWGLRIATAW